MSMSNKQAYFQGTQEPTPGKKQYPSDPAITVQPRFIEPLYRNYDIYKAEGVNGNAQHGPGSGWSHMNDYKSIQEFLQYHRQKIHGKYVAEDNWITNDNRTERVEKMKLRSEMLASIIKTAKNDENADYMLPPKEHGTGIYDWKNSLYQNLKKYKSVDQYRKQHNAKYHKQKSHHDKNSLDFIVDDQFKEFPPSNTSETYTTPVNLGPSSPDISTFPNQVNLGDYDTYPQGNLMGGYLDKYLGQPDQDGKPESTLDYGYDLTEEQEESGRLSESDLEKLFNKYLNPSPNHGQFGLPDGVDLPDEDLGDPTNINPDYGTVGPESLIYEDKWNI